MVNDTSAPERAVRLTALGAAVRNARGQRSQCEIATELGRPQSSISAWESGSVDLSVERIYHLEAALRVSHGTLLRASGYIDDSTPWWRNVRLGVPSDDLEFGDNLASWLAEHGHLIEAVADLRTSGCHEAVEAMLNARPLAELRLTWAFWRSLLDDPADTDLMGSVDEFALSRCQFAIWGDETASADSSNG
jgi:transcriptional regulator with XRE-family HTH domain